MKEIKLGSITLNLSNEGDNVRVKSVTENVLLTNQNIENVSELIQHNFNIISNHYKIMIKKQIERFDLTEINHVSVDIEMYYLYTYNSWRSMYKKRENKDLRFKDEDFDQPSTHDIIFNFYKARYPSNWEEKCSLLLGMKMDDLKAYYKNRQEFYNK